MNWISKTISTELELLYLSLILPGLLGIFIITNLDLRICTLKRKIDLSFTRGKLKQIEFLTNNSIGVNLLTTEGQFTEHLASLSVSMLKNWWELQLLAIDTTGEAR